MHFNLKLQKSLYPAFKYCLVITNKTKHSGCSVTAAIIHLANVDFTNCLKQRTISFTVIVIWRYDKPVTPV